MRSLPDATFDGDDLERRDPALVRAAQPWFERFNRRYIRLRLEGTENLIGGPVLYVGNHNNGMSGPDVAATLSTLWSHFGPEAPIYGLAHDWAMRQLPAFGRLVQRFGGVRASRSNACRILERGGIALVYPGGVPEAFRSTWYRDRIDFGDRIGFVEVAQATGVPIVPVVAHGAHRSAFILTDGEDLARRLGLWELRQERCPIALALPWGVVVGPFLPYLPLPFRVTLRFLPPITVAPDADARTSQRRIVSLMQIALDQIAAAPGQAEVAA